MTDDPFFILVDLRFAPKLMFCSILTEIESRLSCGFRNTRACAKAKEVRKETKL